MKNGGNRIMNRWSAILGLVVVLAGLILFGATHNPWVTLNDALAQPDRYDGRVINLFIYPRIERIDADGFDIREAGGPIIHVLGDTTGLKAGEYVGMQAIFHKDGVLTATHANVARRRNFKVLFSLFPVAFVGFLFFRSYRWNVKKFQFEARHA
jgi:hypothetical protein